MNRSKIARIFAGSVLTCLMVAGAVTGAELRLTTQDFAPFHYEAEGNASGPAVEIVRAICNEMGISCSIDVYPWGRAQQLVKRGKADGLFVIGKTEERTRWLHFSPPLLSTEYGFFVRDDNPREFKTLSDIKGYTVGVYGPSNTARSLEKVKDEITDLKIDMTPHDEAPFKKVSRGRIDAVYSNRDVGYAMVKKLGLKNIKYLGKHRRLEYYIGFSKSATDKNTVEKFNAALLELYKNGVIPGILKKFFLEPVEM